MQGKNMNRTGIVGDGGRKARFLLLIYYCRWSMGVLVMLFPNLRIGFVSWCVDECTII